MTDSQVHGVPRSKEPLYERIKGAILSGDLAPGQQLVETTLATSYGVSRTPVRQALTRLEQDGLIERTHRGLVVRERSPDEILDIYEVRIGLEASAASTAATRRTTMDLIALRRLDEQMGAMDGSDAPAIAVANREFHQAIWTASHSKPLIDLLTRLNLHLARFTATTLSEPGRWQQARDEHRDILSAIEDRDPERAARVAAHHFETARNLRLAIWARASDS
jgi:DNA-binding GntR family transcriptional regulator